MYSPLSGIVQTDGTLHSISPNYIEWAPGNEFIRLDGDFTVYELAQITGHLLLHHPLSTAHITQPTNEKPCRRTDQ